MVLDPTPVLAAVKTVLHVWTHIEAYDDPESAVEGSMDALHDAYTAFATLSDQMAVPADTEDAPHVDTPESHATATLRAACVPLFGPTQPRTSC